MNAMEFQTTIKNSFIQIPNYEEFENKQVRIIILDNTPSESTPTTVNNFILRHTNKPIHTSSDIEFLSRDEANER